MRINGVSDGIETFEEDLSKTETALRSVGVEVRNVDNSFRPAIDVLADVASKFNTLNDAQRSYVTEAMAGKILPSNIVIY